MVLSTTWQAELARLIQHATDTMLFTGRERRLPATELLLLDAAARLQLGEENMYT